MPCNSVRHSTTLLTSNLNNNMKAKRDKDTIVLTPETKEDQKTLKAMYEILPSGVLGWVSVNNKITEARMVKTAS